MFSHRILLKGKIHVDVYLIHVAHFNEFVKADSTISVFIGSVKIDFT